MSSSTGIHAPRPGFGFRFGGFHLGFGERRAVFPGGLCGKTLRLNPVVCRCQKLLVAHSLSLS
jgi:hypothetical protein